MSAAAIPIPPVVEVNITRATLFPTAAGFGTLLAASTSAVIPHGERVRFYTSIAGVAVDFATTLDEYLMAVPYFSQSPSADRLGIGFIATADQKGYLKGGTAVSVVATWNAISDGSAALTIDGVGPSNATGMDFSSDTSMDDVAATIQVVVRAIGGGGFAAADVTWNATGFFTITSGVAGASSAVLFLTAAGVGTAIEGAGFMGCDVTGGGTEVAGYAYVSLTDELNRCAAASDDWYGLALGRQLYSSANYQEAAAFTQAQTTRRRMLFARTDEVGALDPSVSSDLMSVLNAAAYDHALTVYESLVNADEYMEVAAASVAFTVDFDGQDTASTLKFQLLRGITPSNLNVTQIAAVKAKFGNVYITRGGSNMLEEGYVAVGEFFDVMHYSDWQEQDIALRNFGRLYNATTKIPYTDKGTAILKNETRDSLKQGVTNGGIARDVDPVTDELLDAYTITVIPVADVSAAQRALREGPAQTFTARLAGAIHFTSINGTLTV